MTRRARAWTATLAVLLAALAAWWIASRPRDVDALDSVAPRARVVADAEAVPAIPSESRWAASQPAASRSALAQPTTRAEAATGPGIRIRVLRRNDTPVAGAHVETFDDSTPSRGTTDADGRCVVPVVPDTKSFRLRVVAEGLFHADSTYLPRAELEIRLADLVTLSGFMRDAATHTPIARASITLDHGHGKGCEPDRAQSADDGTFTVVVPTDHDLPFVFAAEGWPTQLVTFRIPSPGGPVRRDFVLQRGVEIRGRVVDLATGQPIAGAALDIADGLVQAHADSAGQFHSLVLPSARREVRIECRAPGYCLVHGSVAEAAFGQIEIPMPRGTEITGTVRDHRGAPLAGVAVGVAEDFSSARDLATERRAPAGMPDAWRTSALSRAGRATTDERGRYRTSGVVPGRTYRISASLAGYQRGDRRSEFVPPDAATVAVDFVLDAAAPAPPTGTVTGRFRLNGKATAAVIEADIDGRRVRVEPDAAGAFRVAGLAPGRLTLTATPWNIEFGALSGEQRQRLCVRRTVDVVAGAEQSVDLELETGMSAISGRVTRPDGSPATGEIVGARSDNRLALEARTAADGRWELGVPTLIAGWRVGVSGAETPERRVEPGGSNVDFVVPGRGVVRYRMLQEDGSPIDPTICVRRAGTWALVASAPRPEAADAEGYRVIDLRQGRHDLLFMDPSPLRPIWSPHVVREVDVGTTPREITVRAVRGLQVTIRRHRDSAPLPGREAQLVDAAFGDTGTGPIDWPFASGRRIQLDRNQPSVLPGVGPGRHRLVASDPAIEIVPSTIDVGTSSDQVFEISWRRREK